MTSASLFGYMDFIFSFSVFYRLSCVYNLAVCPDITVLVDWPYSTKLLNLSKQ